MNTKFVLGMCMVTAKKYIITFILCISCLFFSGCSNNYSDQHLIEKYAENNRIDKYYDLRDRYDNIKVIMILNIDEDRMWITNFTLWVIFSILPDILFSHNIILQILWWIFVFVLGSGILGALTVFGTGLGIIPGIPVAIGLITFICAMFSLLFY